ncbi:mannitol dehydrogenase family protein [Acetanaerobacterium elongatum]|uniref:Fructuronate reductase n=1 Tax=Acetanaerobacterium elongatum TaxID=258515 RepID=A0A1H0C6Z4_9FIRM|nr:mannitol dehydrogenase family protein [Acetanaerobacterium elongatum]SDN53611.1 fructuronate reductase [Acetanaerobacterium elongatum]
MNLNYEGIRDSEAWQEAKVRLPRYDVQAVAKATKEHPVWLHFGAGNIFRGFIAALQDRLLNEGLANKGIVAVESFDYDIIKEVYAPHDNLTLLVTLKADGNNEKSVVASIAAGFTTADDFAILQGYFKDVQLRMVSFTITEKGYSLFDMSGNLLPVADADMKNGPQKPVHVMAVLTSLLYTRYKNGMAPIALVSMDNCSHNGEKLANAVKTVAAAWEQAGFVDKGFLAYIGDEKRVSFPWSMIDKITPRPDGEIYKALTESGIEGMAPIVTGKGTYIAPFVNAEAPQYLVVEDSFPAGRPMLEKAGVYFTSRDTVNRMERMKVTTCLNPLHTALAVFGCLLGYTKISEEMKDEQLSKLVRRIGYVEGLPVVTHPGILEPRAFLDEVVNERLPNPYIPDTPQRIACDTSQKIPIRFGETIKAYLASPEWNTDCLTGISLALAGWLRYLLGVDDELNPMTVSSDPLLNELQAALAGIEVGDPQSAEGKLDGILHNAALFGVDLFEAGLADRVQMLFECMLQGKGAVRALLKDYIG